MTSSPAPSPFPWRSRNERTLSTSRFSCGGRCMRHGYLIDMDGVLYRGKAIIPGADRFVEELRRRDIPFRLLTNNSQRTRRDVVAKVARIGIDVEEEHIFTSAMATARFLA